MNRVQGIIVHEWIEQNGGAEQVLDRFASIFPDAPIACLWDDSIDRYPKERTHESVLARTPLRRHKALALPVMPAIWRARWRSLPDADWVLASSHLFAHQFESGRRWAGARKFAYVHTPARYLWAPEVDPRGSNLSVRAVAPFFRTIDRRLAQAPDEIAANSAFVRDRIERAWHRDARIIHPPVHVAEIQSVSDWAQELNQAEREFLESLPQAFILGASRLVSYKRLDLVIDAGEASDLPVVVAGGGPAERELRERAAVAKVPVVFAGPVSDQLLRALYQRALVYVFPAIEDFGIMPVEAMACGTPIIVRAVGGTQEALPKELKGAMLDGFSRQELAQSVSQAASIDSEVVRRHARLFSAERFDDQILNWLG